jgi:bromodomain-containing protein 8
MQTEDTENLKEYKLWKKAIMLVWRTASTHKNASLFLHPVTDNEAKGYTDIVRQPMDLTSLKKRIENGVIRTTVEFQRDIMLMFQNAIMFNEADHDVHKMAVEMQKETIESIQDFIETQQQNNQSNESKLRARERRSATTITEVRKLKIKKLKFFLNN